MSPHLSQLQGQTKYVLSSRSPRSQKGAEVILEALSMTHSIILKKLQKLEEIIHWQMNDWSELK